MTANMESTIREAMSTRETCGWSYDAFCKESQTLRGFESRAWRILTHDSTIEKWRPVVARQHAMCLTSIASNKHSWVVGRCRHHSKHLAS